MRVDASSVSFERKEDLLRAGYAIRDKVTIFIFYVYEKGNLCMKGRGIEPQGGACQSETLLSPLPGVMLHISNYLASYYCQIYCVVVLSY